MASNAEIEAGLKEILWQHAKENSEENPSKGHEKNRKQRPNSGQRRQRNVDRPPPENKKYDGEECKFEADRSGGRQNRHKQMRQAAPDQTAPSGTDSKYSQNKNRLYPKKKLATNNPQDHVECDDRKGKDSKKRVRRQKSRGEDGVEGRTFNRQGSAGKKNDGDSEQSKEDPTTGLSVSAKKKKRKKKKKNAKGEEENIKNETVLTPTTEDGISNLQDKKPIGGQELLNPLSQSSPEVLKELSVEYIYPLKKRSLKFPSAKFFCRLCEYHCDTETVCRKHMKDTRHQRLRMIKTTDILLRSLPFPAEIHVAALDQLTESIYRENALSEKELAQRQLVADKMAQVIKEKLPEANAKLSVYGSTATRFALNDSDLNLDLTAEDSAKVLANLHLILKDDQSGYFSDVKSDFGAKVPSVLFKVAEHNLKCQLGVNSGSASQTTRLLTAYANIDPRVKKLAVVFRYWARLCKVDCQDAGTLPPYAFAIMTVYFLQQCEPPVLPVFEELSNTEPKLSEDTFFENLENMGKAWKTKNDWSLGQLWIGLLKFYAVSLDISCMVICIRQRRPLTRDEKKWASKKLAIEDPFARKRNIARSVSHSHVFEYIYDRLRAGYLYYGVPQTQEGPLLEKVDTSKLEHQLQENLKKLNESPTSPVRALPGASPSETPVSDTTTTPLAVVTQKETPILKETPKAEEELKPVTLESGPGEEDAAMETDKKPTVDQLDKQSATLAFASSLVEDVLSEAMAELGISPSIGKDLHQAEGEGLKEEGVSLELSESDNDLEDGEALSGDDMEEAVEEPGTEESLTTATLEEEDEEEEELKGTQEESEKDDDDEEEEGSDDDSDVYEEAKEEIDEETKVEEPASIQEEKTSHKAQAQAGQITYDQEVLGKLRAEDLVFKFDELTLSDGKGPAIMCSICQQEGHLKQNCPEEKLPDLEPLPPMTNVYRNLLDKIIMQVPRDFEPKPSELKTRNEVLREIENFVRQTYPSAKLTLFGSSCNGFGFGHSDLDICMTLEQETAEGLDCVEIIETLSGKLRKHRGLYNVLAITTAKVPIVKFRHRRSQLEGDISLYNTLAQHNTRMLQLYSEADYRVKALGYTMKVFGKLCNICDASRGSLSSYAYIIMVLYFLQQRKPAIIPVLQEVYKGDKPELIVEGWNAWYYDNLKNLRKDWPDYGKNKETVGELWLGMLRFYTEEFNFRDYVISVRQHKPLTRFEKLWNGKCVAIEDPFDMSHNLGAGVSRKMNMYIMKALRNGRKIFGTPIEQTPLGYNSLSDYLFDPQLLTEGEPPNDRGCRACGKIGHFAKECPIVLARKERNERERERRKEEREQVEDDPGRGKQLRQDSDNRNDNRRQRDQDNRQHNHKGNYQGSSPRAIPPGARSYGSGGQHASPHGGDLAHSPYSGGPSYGTPPYHGSSPRMAGSGGGGGAMNAQVFYNSNMRDGGHMPGHYGGRHQKFASPTNTTRGRTRSPRRSTTGPSRQAGGATTTSRTTGSSNNSSNSNSSSRPATARWRPQYSASSHNSPDH